MAVATEQTLKVSIYNLKPNPYQPEARLTFPEDDVKDMAGSLLIHGQLSPLIVREDGHKGEYQVADGWLRRAGALWNCSHEHGKFEEVTVIVRELTDQQMADYVIEANSVRVDLSPIDKALSYKRYMAEFHFTQVQIAERHHCTQAEISNTLRLLELPADVKHRLITQEISETHCRVLLQVKDAETVSKLAAEATENGMTVNALDIKIKEILGKTKQTRKPQAGQEQSLFLTPPAGTAPATITATPAIDTMPKETQEAVVEIAEKAVETVKAESPKLGILPAAMVTPQEKPAAAPAVKEAVKEPQTTASASAARKETAPAAQPAVKFQRKMSLTETADSVLIMLGTEGAVPFMKKIAGTIESIAAEIPAILTEAAAKWQTATAGTAKSVADENKTVTPDKPAEELPLLNQKKEEGK